MSDAMNDGQANEGSVPTLTGNVGELVADEAAAPTVLIDDDSTRAVSELFCPTCGGHFPGGTSNCTEDGTGLLPVGFGNDLAGTVLKDKYVLVQLIGSGGFGHVYRATHKLAKAEIAIKVIRDEIRDNVKARRQFLKEARALMRIQSRHAVVVHDVDEDSAGRIFIVMEFLRGQDLEDHLKVVSPDTRRLGWQETARIVIQMCDALEDAHEQGIVHRDLKPGNVMMIKGRGGQLMAKVVDFGIASLAQSGDMDLTTMDSVPRVIGTPSFMSPEQAKGQVVDHRSDLYSLGAMMYRLVCGCRPFNAKTDQGMLIAHVTEEPTSVLIKCPEAQVPPAFDALLMQMLKKNPDDRPADAAEIAERLKAMLPAEAKPVVEKKGSGSGKKIAMVAVAVVVVAAVVGMGIFLLTQSRGTDPAVAGAADVVQAGAVQAAQPTQAAAAQVAQPVVAQPTQAAQPGNAQPVQAGAVGTAAAGKPVQAGQQVPAQVTGQAPVQAAAVQPTQPGNVQPVQAAAVQPERKPDVKVEAKVEAKPEVKTEAKTEPKPVQKQAQKVETPAKPDNAAAVSPVKPTPPEKAKSEPVPEPVTKRPEMTAKDKEVLEDLQKKGTGKGTDSKRKKVGSDADSAFDELDNL